MPKSTTKKLNQSKSILLFTDKQYPTQGNWAHIRYATRAEKERAMNLCGRQVLPGIMVGVVECREVPRISVASPGITSPERLDLHCAIVIFQTQELRYDT